MSVHDVIGCVKHEAEDAFDLFERVETGGGEIFEYLTQSDLAVINGAAMEVMKTLSVLRGTILQHKTSIVDVGN